MTEAEICRSYRNAMDRKKQIPILQDLTGKSKEEILEILAAGGEDINLAKKPSKEPAKEAETLKKAAKAVDVAAEQLKREPPKQSMVLPEAVAIALYNQLEILDQEIRKKEEQYRDIVAFIQAGGQQA